MSYLAQPHPWLSDADGLYNQSIFSRISEEIAAEVLRRQNLALAAPPPDWLLNLIRVWDNQKSPVLSLNYDMILEKALWTAARVAYVHAYQIPTPPIDTRAGRAAYDEEPHPTLRLFKLHGSINWYYHGPHSQSAPIYDLVLLEWQPDSLSTIRERSSAERCHWSSPP